MKNSKGTNHQKKAVTKQQKTKDPCPKCGKELRAKELCKGGGVECVDKKCGYWFCF